MDSLKVTIAPEDWGNLVTKYAPHAKKVKVGDFTAGSKNLDTDVNGFITKRKGGPNYNSVALSGPTKDQYEAIFSDGTRHLLVVTGGTFKYSSGDTVFNTVQNGSGFVAAANFEFVTTQNRVYGGNTAANIVYDRSTSYGGVAYTAPRIKTMGAQAPATALVAGAPTAGGAVPAGAHTYKVTFLYYGAEESNGSTASGAQTAGAGNFTIPLSSIPIGGYGVTARKIYRDNNDGNYVHLTTISDNTTTVFNDNLLAGATPTPIPTDHFVPPAFGLCATWLDKVWIAAISGEPFLLRHSEAQLPDIFPDEFEVVCNQEDPITALIVYYGRLMVFNRKSFGQILGTTSDTFRYDQIPSSVGCVDNRTLQIRVVNGVPVLIWLSDRGFYRYDGNSVDYISDFIEDLVNFNIQQAIQQKNTNTQSSQADFSGGTASNGIDITTIPGDVRVKGYADGGSGVGNNPRRTLDDQTDWESGTQAVNLALRAGDNRLKPVRRNQLSGAGLAGTRTGDMSASGNIALSTFANFTGVTRSGGQDITGYPTQTTTKVAQPIALLARAGTITQVSVSVHSFLATDPTKNTFKITVWANNAGTPGTVLAQSGNLICTDDSPFSFQSFTLATSIPLSAGQNCFIGIELVGTPNFRVVLQRYQFINPFGIAPQYFDAGAWHVNGVATLGAVVGFVFSQTPVSKNGTYTSATYNTDSVSLNSAFISSTGSFPNVFGGTKNYSLIVDVSNDGIFWTQGYLNSTRANVSNGSVTVSGHRYFRIRVTMFTSDDRETDTVSLLRLDFPNPVEWISPVIDCTSDVTLFNSYTNVSNANGGTLSFLIATSADDITYTPFVSFGSHTVQRYVKLKVVLTMSGDNVPYVTSITFTWTVVANLVSSAIDTGATPPAGWDLFLSDYTPNGGTVVFQMRSASSLVGLSSATFFTITPGDFPGAVTPFQYTQWKVILTSTDGHNPIVSSVTVQWFIGNTTSIRPASIFADGRYYCALAELEETTNNIIIEFDLNGKWRIYEDLKVSTFSFFFNRPYAGMADSGFVRKYLGSNTDNGSAIELDVRTKAFDFSTLYQDNSEYIKIVERAILQVTNTGASYKVFYSVDNGVTFYPMYLDNGSDTLTTTNDGGTTYRTFKPTWVTGVPYYGRTIMYRFWSNDINEVEIQSFKANALKRLQEPE